MTDVSVSRDELTFTANGKSGKFKRVKDYSARLRSRLHGKSTSVQNGDSARPEDQIDPKTESAGRDEPGKSKANEKTRDTEKQLPPPMPEPEKPMQIPTPK